MRPPHLPTIEIKGHFLKNPFVVLPYATPITNPVGRVTPELLMHYKALARSEAALVIAGPATITTPPTRKASLLRIDQPKYLDGLRALIKIITSNGSLPGVQLDYTAENKIELIQEGKLDKFHAKFDVIEEDKLLSAYRNAAARACEVGFAYVELNASGFTHLHQLCHENRREWVGAIFEEVRQSLNEEAIFGLRLDSNLADAQAWIDLFLQHGGDFVAGEAPCVSGAPPENRFPVQQEHLEIDALERKLKSCRLIGLPFHFKHKHKQVLQFYQIGSV